MSSKILGRIEAQLGAPGLAAALAELAPSDLQSLLLEVFRTRAKEIRPVDLLDERRGLCTVCSADARRLHGFDGAAYAAAEGFDAVELSPVSPAGGNTVLGRIDQNSTLAAIRNVELLSDPTIAQTLEAARRRRGNRARTVKLCSSQRLMRLQPFDNPGYTRHFRLFSLVTAGRDAGNFSFECAALREQLQVYLRLLGALPSLGFRIGAITVELADSGVIDVLGISRDELSAKVRAHNHAAPSLLEGRTLPLPQHADDPRGLTPLAGTPSELRLARAHEAVIEPLRAEFPSVRFRYDLWRLEGATYYRGLCFRINVVDIEGLDLPLGDGGFTDWTQRLLSDGKERLLATGIANELACKRYV
jgi:hypothetical protein